MMRNGGLALLGEDAFTWGSALDSTSHCHDLVAVCPPPKEDTFSHLMAKYSVRLLSCSWCTRFNRPSKHGVDRVGYKYTTIFRLTYWATILLASLLPVVSIVVLYFTRSMVARLCIVAAFNILVSACLGAFTKATRAEIFAVTAA